MVSSCLSWISDRLHLGSGNFFWRYQIPRSEGHLHQPAFSGHLALLIRNIPIFSDSMDWNFAIKGQIFMILWRALWIIDLGPVKHTDSSSTRGNSSRRPVLIRGDRPAWVGGAAGCGAPGLRWPSLQVCLLTVVAPLEGLPAYWPVSLGNDNFLTLGFSFISSYNWSTFSVSYASLLKMSLLWPLFWGGFFFFWYRILVWYLFFKHCKVSFCCFLASIICDEEVNPQFHPCSLCVIYLFSSGST